MTPRDWTDLARVYRAGATRARGWTYNHDAQREAEVLDAQADECDLIAAEREAAQ